MGEVLLTLKEEILSTTKQGEGSPTLKEEILSQQTKEKRGQGSLYPTGRNPLSTTNTKEKMGDGSPYPKGRSPLNNKHRRRWEKVLLILREEIFPTNPSRRQEKVLLILKEEILSQQQTKEKRGECSPYPKGRNTLNNKPRRRFSYPKSKKSSQ